MCQFLRPITVGTQKLGMLVRLTPGVIGQEFGDGEGLTGFVLTTRFEGADIGSIQEFPCFVSIALPTGLWDASSDRVEASHLDIIGWGELYRTASDAEEHKFG